MPETETALRICPLCEATCGLTLTIDDGRVTGARGDRDDVFSDGFICPKGASFAELDNDPDRLSAPLVRRDGVLTEATWDEAFAVVAERLGGSHARARRDVGRRVPRQPERAHDRGRLYAPLIIRALGTRQVYSASTLDQMPKHVALGLHVRQPRRVHGARPRPHRLSGDHRRESPCVQRQFGHRRRLPRQAAGAAQARRPAHRHRPGPHPHRRTRRPPHRAAPRHRRRAAVRGRARAVRRGPCRTGSRRRGRPRHRRRATSAQLADGFAPEAVAAHCGVAADEIRALAREIAAAPTAAVYGRIGTSTVEFGTLGSWLVDVINILTGNLDRPGGAMFPLVAGGSGAAPAEAGPGFAHRALAQPGLRAIPKCCRNCPPPRSPRRSTPPARGRSRPMITIAGNPVLSAPDGDRLDRALDGVGLHAQHRPVPQRDDAPRRRHPAATAAIAERPLRLRAQQPGGAQQRPLLAARAAAATAGPTSRRSCPGSR